MKTHPIITQSRLMSLCLYDPATGIFTWRIARPKCKPGAVVGVREPRGYVVAKLDYRLYYLHRLAWLYMTGEWPVDDVDHIDRDKSNNRWGNLRAATAKQNAENSGLRKSNRSGVTGVSKWNGYWVARIKSNYKSKTIGYFKDFDSAVKARKEAEKTVFTHAPLQSSCHDDPCQQGGTG